MKNRTIKKVAVTLGMACYALTSSAIVLAQDHAGHDMANMPQSAMSKNPKADQKPAGADKKKNPKKSKPGAKLAPAKTGKAPHRSGMNHAKMPGMDHSKMKDMDHGTMPDMDHSKMQGMDHGNMPGMDHSKMQGMDHSNMPGMDHSKMPGMDHGNMPGMDHRKMQGMDHSKMPGMQQDSMQGMKMGPMQGGSAPPDARDPNAYAEGLTPHAMHGMDMADDALFGRVMINELEATHSRHSSGQNLNAEAWYGGDYNKAWLKVEGDRSRGTLEGLRTEVLWDRVFAPFWGTQLGLRHDIGNGPARNWLAFGVRGLAPYWFETEATAYIGRGGALAARAEARYELLLTQRLILEPKVETNLYSKNDAVRGIGAGLSDLALGLRLRYEVRRQFAPYVGVSWKRKFGNTANLARQSGADVSETQLAAGVRLWF